jgi:hypothetical protein
MRHELMAVSTKSRPSTIEPFLRPDSLGSMRGGVGRFHLPQPESIGFPLTLIR